MVLRPCDLLASRCHIRVHVTITLISLFNLWSKVHDLLQLRALFWSCFPPEIWFRSRVFGACAVTADSILTHPIPSHRIPSHPMMSHSFSFVLCPISTMFCIGLVLTDGGKKVLDTKYEMGKDAHGAVMIVDDIHTADASDYCIRVCATCVCTYKVYPYWPMVLILGIQWALQAAGMTPTRRFSHVCCARGCHERHRMYMRQCCQRVH